MQILGLHLEKPYLRIALIKKTRKKIEILSLKSFFLSSPEDVKQIYNGDGKVLAASMPCIVRQLKYKFRSIKQVQQVLPSQLESIFPIDMKELVYASINLFKNSSIESTIYAESEENLKKIINEYENFSLQLEVLTSTAKALTQFICFKFPEIRSAFLIDIGTREWTCVLMDSKEVKKSFTIAGGNDALLLALWEDRKKVLFQKEVEGVAKQIDLLQLKRNLNPLLSERLEEFRSQFSTVLETFLEGDKSHPVFFTGQTNVFGHLCQFLLEKAPKQVYLYDTSASLTIDELKCATAIGSALEAAQKQNQVQFLKGAYTPRKAFRKAGIFGIGIFLLALIISGALVWTTINNYRDEKIQISDSLKAVLKKFDPNFAQNIFFNSLDEHIFYALRTIQKYDKEASFLLSAPSVSEILAWLSSHPLFKIGFDDALELIEMKYQLASFPRIGSPKSPYQAKVEIEFRAKNSMLARKFHENLLSESPMIDTSQEITWEVLPESYRTSFYLKNRTPYVR